MADITRSNEFLQEFHKRRDEITSTITSSNALSTKELQVVGSSIAQLSSTLLGAVSFLTLYDQRLCDQDLKTLQEGLEKRKQALPKSRFAFKKKAVSPVDSATPPPSTDPVIPQSQLEEPEASSSVKHDKTSNSLIDGHIGSLLSSDSLSLPSTPTDITISNLSRCVLELQNATVRPTALYIRGLRNTFIIAGMVTGSVRIEDCRECVFVTGSQQFRIERCEGCDIYCYVSSLPVIEESRGMRFAPFPTELVSLSAEPSKPSQHYSVKDFSWIRATPSPNWAILPDDQKIDWKTALKSLAGTKEETGDQKGVITEEIQKIFPVVGVQGGDEVR